MIIIKKEKDNKLYDSQEKKYIVLEHILSYIEKDIQFKVIDSDHKDITKQTLYSLMFYKNHSLKGHSLKDLISFINQGLERIKYK